MGTTGLISRANDEAFYKLISQRGRGGSFPGLELKKMEVDSNIAGKRNDIFVAAGPEP